MIRMKRGRNRKSRYRKTGGKKAKTNAGNACGLHPTIVKGGRKLSKSRSRAGEPEKLKKDKERRS